MSNLIMSLDATQKFKLINNTSMFKEWLLLALVALALGQVVPLHQHVINQIFQENKVYLIYVHGPSHNFQAEGVFNSYCFGDKLCAILEPNVDKYENVLQFVGIDEEEYFLIMDPISKFKYVLTLPQNKPLTDQSLLQFQYRAIHHQMEPFFASQPVPHQQQPQPLKVVGKNLGEFVRRSQRIKIILLYSLSQHCQACPAILEQYNEFVRDYPRKHQVVFGHFNTLLNDHPAIRDQKTPNFIIFVEERHHAPYQMPGDNLAQLDIFINQLLSQSAEDVSQIEQLSEDKTL